MPKIIIHGSTLGSNFGDCLFAKLFYDYCEDINPGQNLFYENKFPVRNEAVALSEHYRNVMKYYKKCTFRDVLNCDGIVFMAGGYFGETTGSLKEAVLRFYKYIKLGLYAIWFRKPLAIIGIGAGPLSHRFIRIGARIVFNHADIITVRNEESRTFLEQIGVRKDIIVTADAAQVVGKMPVEALHPEVEQAIRELCGERRIVLLHCVTPDKQLKVVEEKIIPAMNSFFEGCTDEYAVILTVDQCSLDKSKELKQLASKLNTERFYVYQYSDPKQMQALINISDFVISTKLHVGIVSCSMGKAVVAFPFNSTKICRYYSQIGESERCLPIKNAEIKDIEEVIRKFYGKKVALSNKVIGMAEENFIQLGKFIASMQERGKAKW